MMPRAQDLQGFAVSSLRYILVQPQGKVVSELISLWFGSDVTEPSSVISVRHPPVHDCRQRIYVCSARCGSVFDRPSAVRISSAGTDGDKHGKSSDGILGWQRHSITMYL